MFDGFEERDIATPRATIHARIGGSGPPLLLLHGYPQTHVIWRKVAPALARHFTVVASDLRGYGDSSKPASDPSHLAYSKRSMAADQVSLMQSLGFERFRLAGHDRGARVAHRLTLDYPERVERLAVLDIVPTRYVFATTDRRVAEAYYHWFFLIQPAPLPETLIGHDPIFYLHAKLKHWGRDFSAFEPEALREYERCFSDPAVIHASCEDYRAAATVDLEHDDADLDRMIEVPVLTLWGEKGFLATRYDVLATWQERARTVSGRSLPCGHFLPEECPEETIAELQRLFTT